MCTPQVLDTVNSTLHPTPFDCSWWLNALLNELFPLCMMHAQQEGGKGGGGEAPSLPSNNAHLGNGGNDLASWRYLLW